MREVIHLLLIRTLMTVSKNTFIDQFIDKHLHSLTSRKYLLDMQKLPPGF